MEVTRGKLLSGSAARGIVDTPGMYSLMPITEEERITRRLLLEERPDLVLHVIDAKNLKRMLNLTLQLIEAGLPVVAVVNMIDEAKRLGIEIDFQKLEQLLGIPVVATSAATGEGIEQLKRILGTAPFYSKRQRQHRLIAYDPEVEKRVAKIEELLSGSYALTKRSIALLLLQGDQEIEELVATNDAANYPKIKEVITEAQKEAEAQLAWLISKQRQEKAWAICSQAVAEKHQNKANWGELFSRLTLHPLTGVPLLFFVLYFGLYRFVGGFGAGTLVNWLETIYERTLTPQINAWVEQHIPLPALQSLLAGDYGILTMALRYALAIVLPIVGAFFLVFAVIEDSGYLPRLAALADRIFKSLGMSGRAVIPLVLGFGCDTMATMVTRTLESSKERVISTLLLALAIPCSAQLGIVLGILSSSPKALAIWTCFILLVFLLVGFLSARLLPGESAGFFMELPPMRLPRLQNVLVKTYTRMVWYFLEVLPLFVLASVIIWIGELTGAFDLLLKALAPAMGLLGLPPETASVFLFGFFRRDYGAAGLFDLYSRGGLTGVQLIVAAVTLTLFVPCIAQFIMMVKERGAKTALAIATFTLLAAFCSGYTLFHVLAALGVSL